jgi:ABC-type amino acid transport substrate-binding protein
MAVMGRATIVLAGALLASVLLAGPAGASRGTLVVVSGAAGASARGADVDLARAMANVLGYRVSLVGAAPSAIVPGLASGEYDLGMSVVDTAARERSVDVVTLRPVGAPSGVAVPKGTRLTGEVMSALRTLIAEGTYREILAKWGLPAGGVARPTLNAASHGRT